MRKVTIEVAAASCSRVGIPTAKQSADVISAAL